MRRIILVVAVVAMLILVTALVFLSNTGPGPTDVEDSVDQLVPAQQQVTLFDGRNSDVVESSEEIRSSFDVFITDPSYIDTFGGFTKLGLTNVLAAIDAQVLPSLNPLLDQMQWDVYRCDDSSSQYTPLALSLTLSPDQSFQGNLYQKSRQEMSRWEPTIVDDLSSLFFPVQPESPEYVKQGSRFLADRSVASVDTRTATVYFTDGATAEFGYLIIGADIIISNSTACLTEARKKIFDLGA